MHLCRLWNELTIAVMQFIYHPQVKGRITFQFYNDFVRFFQKNIDQINLLKIVKECIVKLSSILLTMQRRRLWSFLSSLRRRRHLPKRPRSSYRLSKAAITSMMI